MEQFFDDSRFDLVFESTMFVQITDDKLARCIASEMMRVLKPGGFILIADWRYNKAGDRTYKAMSNGRIKRLFHIGSLTRQCGVYPGMLVPPVGRLLSRRLPFAYFMAQFMFPFLVGQVVTVLKKL